MRKPLGLAAVAFAVAAAVLPVSSASAVCYEWMYELTGYCGPCNVAGHAYREVSNETGITIDEQFLTCSA